MKKAGSNFLALLFLLVTVLPSPVLVRWYCEGRVCGTTYGSQGNCCCVEQVSAARDARCAARPVTTQDSLPNRDSITCGDGCGCRGVSAQGAEKSAVRVDAPVALVLPLLAVLPTASPLPPPTLIARTRMFVVEGRGPPALSPASSPSSPRAPPHA